MNETPTLNSIQSKYEKLITALYYAGSLLSLLLILVLAFFPVRSDDLYMHLAIGRLFFQDMAFPQTDPFILIPGYHWHILHEWGSHLIYYFLFTAGKWNFVIFFKVILILFTASLPFFFTFEREKRTPLVIILVLLSGFAASLRFIERASIFSELFTAVVTFIVLHEEEKKSKLLYLVPFIFLFWVNLHPGFYTGLSVMLLPVILYPGRLKELSGRQYAVCTGFSFLACLINPKGIYGFLFPLNTVLDKSWDLYRAFNYEWMPSLHKIYINSPEMKAFFILAGICLILLIINYKRKPWVHFLAYILFLYLGLSAIRFVSTASFSIAVIGADLACKTKTLGYGSINKYIRESLIVLTVFIIIVELFCVYSISTKGYTNITGYRHIGTGVDLKTCPVNASEFIEKISLKTKLFNQHDFGSYLAWRWNGKRKIFYHGFIDDMKFYNSEYLGINRSVKEFNRIVNKYNFGAFMLTSSEFADPPYPLLYQILLNSPQWHMVYLDDRAVIFLRDMPENQDAITKYKINL